MLEISPGSHPTFALTIPTEPRTSAVRVKNYLIRPGMLQAWHCFDLPELIWPPGFHAHPERCQGVQLVSPLRTLYNRSRFAPGPAIIELIVDRCPRWMNRR